MGARFEFATAGRVIFGAGCVKQAPALAREFGDKAMVVTGANPSRVADFIDNLEAHGIKTVVFTVAGEPTIQLAENGAATAKKAGCRMVVAIGGGSAIDAGKAIAALAANAGKALDYLEVIGAGKPLENAPLPFIAIPTTAGTGAEVTRNAVLASPEHRVKVSLRSPLMLPRIALVDPELTYGLPAVVTASTGMDALTQLIEPFVSCRANPMTDALCRDGVARAARSLRKAFENGQDMAAREDMSLASLYGGLALANAGLGAVHGFAAPIGGMFDAPHGAVCAALLPHVMSANLQAIRQRAPRHFALSRFEEVARLLTGDSQAGAEKGVAWVLKLCGDLGIPPLREYGITTDAADELVGKASKSSSMKGNPLTLTADELRGALLAAI